MLDISRRFGRDKDHELAEVDLAERVLTVLHLAELHDRIEYGRRHPRDVDLVWTQRCWVGETANPRREIVELVAIGIECDAKRRLDTPEFDDPCRTGATDGRKKSEAEQIRRRSAEAAPGAAWLRRRLAERLSGDNGTIGAQRGNAGNHLG